MKVIEDKSGGLHASRSLWAGSWAHPIPGADPGPPTNGGNMERKDEPGFPLHPLGGGAIPCPRSGAILWASACDFLGSPCPRGQTQGWLEGDEEVFEENGSIDVCGFGDEVEDDEFAELIEYLDNQQW